LIAVSQNTVAAPVGIHHHRGLEDELTLAHEVLLVASWQHHGWDQADADLLSTGID